MANRDPDPNGERKMLWERRVARIMGGYFREQRDALPQAMNLNVFPMMPDSRFWGEQEAKLIGVLRPTLKEMMSEIGIEELNAIFRRKQLDEVTPERIIARATQIASARARELSEVINNTTRQALRDALREFFNTPGFTIGDLIDDLSQTIASPVRAQATAVTEVTRAAREGQKITTGLIRDVGLDVVEIWNTNNDGRVCPICAPRHRQVFDPSWEMPAHVNCRCWSTTRLANVEVQEQAVLEGLGAG